MAQTQRLATLFDGVTRHSPEGTLGFNPGKQAENHGKRPPKASEASEIAHFSPNRPQSSESQLNECKMTALWILDCTWRPLVQGRGRGPWLPRRRAAPRRRRAHRATRGPADAAAQPAVKSRRSVGVATGARRHRGQVADRLVAVCGQARVEPSGEREMWSMAFGSAFKWFQAPEVRDKAFL